MPSKEISRRSLKKSTRPIINPELDVIRATDLPFLPPDYLVHRISEKFTLIGQKYLFIPEFKGHTFTATILGYVEIKGWDGKQGYIERHGDNPLLRMTVDSRELSLEESIERFIVRKQKPKGITLYDKEIGEFARAALCGGGTKDWRGFDNFPKVPEYARPPINILWEFYGHVFG